MKRQEILDQLHEGVKIVTFTKADGSERVLRGTLKSEYIPPVPTSDGEKTTKKRPNEEVVPVYDLDINDWRAFRIDRLISIEDA